MTDDPVTVPPDAFIRKTGQVWKLVVGTIILPFIIVAILLLQMRRLDRPASEMLPWLAVALVGLLLTLWLLVSVSCPSCKRGLLRHVFTDPDSNSAITTFLARRDCPRCGYTP